MTPTPPEPMPEQPGTLAATEPHPCAVSAMDYLLSIPTSDLWTYQHAYASCAIERNRLAEICGETLRRLLSGEPVSDRYLLGLAWNIKSMREKQDA